MNTNLCFRSLDPPPESTICLLECMAILKGLKEMNAWKNLSDMIEEPNFLDGLHELDLNKINQRQQTQVRTKLKFLKKTIDIENISKVECSILNYVESVLKYCAIYQDIIPLKNKINKSEKHHLDATLKLKEHEDSLTNTRNALSELEKSLNNVSKENDQLKNDNGLLKTKFEYADKLMEGLSSVHDRYKLLHVIYGFFFIYLSIILVFRWNMDLENFNVLKNQIIGNCLLDSSFLIYAGPFSLEYRRKIIFNDWFNNIIKLKIPIDLNFRLENELIDEGVLYE